MKIIPFPRRDRHVKQTAAELRKARQRIAALDAAEADFLAAQKRLAVAKRRVLRLAEKLRPRLARAVAAGRCPTDAWGDPLYTTCERCGELLERYITGADGVRVGMGFVTSPHVCRGRRK